jgi:uncharacterized protein
MEYLVIMRMKDPTDSVAQQRREQARAAHLENAAALRKKGNLLIGGAIFDEVGNPAGSAVVVRFNSRGELDLWLQNDPYTKADVWHEVEVIPYRVAPHYKGGQE